jgi:hypothetical protein
VLALSSVTIQFSWQVAQFPGRVLAALGVYCNYRLAGFLGRGSVPVRQTGFSRHNPHIRFGVRCLLDTVSVPAYLGFHLAALSWRPEHPNRQGALK